MLERGEGGGGGGAEREGMKESEGGRDRRRDRRRDSEGGNEELVRVWLVVSYHSKRVSMNYNSLRRNGVLTIHAIYCGNELVVHKCHVGGVGAGIGLCSGMTQQSTWQLLYAVYYSQY